MKTVLELERWKRTERERFVTCAKESNVPARLQAQVGQLKTRRIRASVGNESNAQMERRKDKAALWK